MYCEHILMSAVRKKLLFWVASRDIGIAIPAKSVFRKNLALKWIHLKLRRFLDFLQYRTQNYSVLFLRSGESSLTYLTKGLGLLKGLADISISKLPRLLSCQQKVFVFLQRMLQHSYHKRRAVLIVGRVLDLLNIVRTIGTTNRLELVSSK